MIPKLIIVAIVAVALGLPQQRSLLRLIEIDPGHSHAAELHAQMLPGFSSDAHVYAPLGPELSNHLQYIARFNSRSVDPTHWSLVVFAGPDYLNRMLQEPPGNVVVLAGRNDRKIDYVEAALAHGENVLGDKPWIIEARDLPRLEQALNKAEEKGVVAYDCMTLRFDSAYQVQRELVGDREIFGPPDRGTTDAPAVRMENLHALLKWVQRGRIAGRRGSSTSVSKVRAWQMWGRT